jgi:hypothetical protein
MTAIPLPVLQQGMAISRQSGRRRPLPRQGLHSIPSKAWQPRQGLHGACECSSTRCSVQSLPPKTCHICVHGQWVDAPLPPENRQSGKVLGRAHCQLSHQPCWNDSPNAVRFACLGGPTAWMVVCSSCSAVGVSPGTTHPPPLRRIVLWTLAMDALEFCARWSAMFADAHVWSFPNERECMRLCQLYTAPSWWLEGSLKGAEPP